MKEIENLCEIMKAESQKIKEIFKFSKSIAQKCKKKTFLK